MELKVRVEIFGLQDMLFWFALASACRAIPFCGPGQRFLENAPEERENYRHAAAHNPDVDFRDTVATQS